MSASVREREGREKRRGVEEKEEEEKKKKKTKKNSQDNTIQPTAIYLALGVCVRSMSCDFNFFLLLLLLEGSKRRVRRVKRGWRVMGFSTLVKKEEKGENEEECL